VRRVVDDEVDPGEVLERPDVAALAADDAALHVVGRQLDDPHGRLRGLTPRDALEGIGDEIARAPLRLRARLVLEPPDPPGEVVAHELLTAVEEIRLLLLERHAGDALEGPLLRRARLLQLVLELPEMRLAVGEALILAAEVDELALDLLLLREHA